MDLFTHSLCPLGSKDIEGEMKKIKLTIILLIGVTIFAGCAYRQRYIPYEKYNKDEIVSVVSPECKSYFLMIKKRVYDFAYKNYNVMEKGEIFLYLTVLKDGTIKSLEVNKNKTNGSERLVDVAVKAAREASPFPPFPENLSQYPELNFKFVVDFGIEK